MTIILPDGSRPDKHFDNPPLHMDGTPKLKFETKVRKGSNGSIEKAIFINGDMLDWAVDASSLMEASRMGPQYFRVVQRDIEKHFIESVSDFIGRKVTAEEIKEAIKTGWI